MSIWKALLGIALIIAAQNIYYTYIDVGKRPDKAPAVLKQESSAEIVDCAAATEMSRLAVGDLNINQTNPIMLDDYQECKRSLDHAVLRGGERGLTQQQIGQLIYQGRVLARQKIQELPSQ